MSKKNRGSKTNQQETQIPVQSEKKFRIWRSFDHFWNQEVIGGGSGIIKTAFKAHLISKKALENQALWVPEAIIFGIEIEE